MSVLISVCLTGPVRKQLVAVESRRTRQRLSLLLGRRRSLGPHQRLVWSGEATTNRRSSGVLLLQLFALCTARYLHGRQAVVVVVAQLCLEWTTVAGYMGIVARVMNFVLDTPPLVAL